MKPDTFDDAYARIQAATKTRTQTEIANLLGIKQSSISDAKKKNTVPDGWLLTLYRTCGLEPDWILYGQEPATRRDDITIPVSVHESGSAYAAPSRVTVYAMASTNQTSGAWIRQGIESIPLPESLLLPNLLVIRMDNTSMEPLIRRNAYVGIDCDDTRLRSGELCALEIPGEGIVIRRIVRDLEGSRLSLQGDNPAYQAQHFPLTNPGLTPVGKPCWVIQEI